MKNVPLRVLLFVSVVCMMNLVLAGDGAWAKKEEKTKKVPVAVPEQEKDTEAAGPLTLVPSVPGKIPGVPDIPKVPKVSTPLSNVYPVSVPTVTPDIDKIQKQINGIIKLNESLKVKYQAQASEIQRITEQAKIHRQILENMSKIKGKRASFTSSGTEEVLQQEKVRLIQKTTEENQKYVETIGREDKQKSDDNPSSRPVSTAVS